MASLPRPRAGPRARRAPARPARSAPAARRPGTRPPPRRAARRLEDAAHLPLQDRRVGRRLEALLEDGQRLVLLPGLGEALREQPPGDHRAGAPASAPPGTRPPPALGAPIGRASRRAPARGRGRRGGPPRPAAGATPPSRSPRPELEAAQVLVHDGGVGVPREDLLVLPRRLGARRPRRARGRTAPAGAGRAAPPPRGRRGLLAVAAAPQGIAQDAGTRRSPGWPRPRPAAARPPPPGRPVHELATALVVGDPRGRRGRGRGQLGRPGGDGEGPWIRPLERRRLRREAPAGEREQGERQNGGGRDHVRGLSHGRGPSTDGAAPGAASAAAAPSRDSLQRAQNSQVGRQGAALGQTTACFPFMPSRIHPPQGQVKPHLEDPKHFPRLPNSAAQREGARPVSGTDPLQGRESDYWQTVEP